jgi:hypothetical protein
MRSLVVGAVLWTALAAHAADAQTVSQQPRGPAGAAASNQRPDESAAHLARIAGAAEAIRAQGEARDKEEREKKDLQAQEDMAFWAKWAFMAAAFQAILGLGGFIVVFGTLKASVQSAKEASKAASASMQSVLAAQHSERAYVVLSHSRSITFNKPAGTVYVVLKVENAGRTPAHVTDVEVRVSFVGGHEESFEPPDNRRSLAFLVAGASITWFSEFRVGEKLLEMLADPNAQTTLWVHGHCDYTDTFGGRRRSGYARYWERSAEDNNLHFSLGPFGNYDREREKGEGDWADYDKPSAASSGLKS